MKLFNLSITILFLGLFPSFVYSAIDPPTNLRSEPTQNAQNPIKSNAYILRWNAPTGPVAFYRLLERRWEEESNTFTPFAEIYRGNFPGFDRVGNPSGQYIYAVEATSPDGSKSTLSNVITVYVDAPPPISAPPNLRSEPLQSAQNPIKSNAYILRWDDSTGPLAFYRLLERRWEESSNTFTPFTEIYRGNFPGFDRVGNPSGQYIYAVEAISPDGSKSPLSNVITVYVDVPPPISAPSNLRSEPLQSAQNPIKSDAYILRWNTSAGPIAFYRLLERRWEESSNTFTPFVEIYRGNFPGFDRVGNPSGQYIYAVEATRPDGSKSPLSNVITVYVDLSSPEVITPEVLVPVQPGNGPLRLSAPTFDNDGTFEVSWQNTDISTLQRSPAESINFTTVFSGPSGSYTERNLAPGRYFYRVETCIVGGEFRDPCTGFIDQIQVIVNPEVVAPGPPPSITAEGSNTGKATVTWSASSGIVEFYRISKSMDSSTEILREVRPDVLTITETDVAAGDVSYSVQACNGIGCSSPAIAPSVSITYAAVSTPKNLRVTPRESAQMPIEEDRYTIRWTASDGPLAFYRLLERRRPAGSATFTPFIEVYQGTGLSFEIKGNTRGEYTYAILARSREDDSESELSEAITVNVGYTGQERIPGPLTTGQANPLVGDNFTLTWAAPTVVPKYYRLLARALGQPYQEIYRGTERSFTVSGIETGSYEYQLFACNDPNDCSLPRFLQVDFFTKPSSPEAVTVPLVSSDGQVNISWTSSAGTFDRYDIAKFSQEGNLLDFIGTSNGTSFSVSGENRSSVRYGVRACLTSVSPEQCSDYQLSKIVTIRDPNNLPVVSEFTVTEKVNQGDYTLNWKRVEGATSYQLVELSNGTSKIVYQGNGSSFTITKQASGSYVYYIQVCLDGNCGNWRFTETGAVEVTNQRSEGEVPDARITNLPVPKHDPTVGALEGEASVDGGNAVYNIPIAVPPGRRGLEPGLAIVYSSAGGQGLAGMGFSLSGLSSISRCGRTFARDGINAPVALNNKDRLCFNGEALVLIKGQYGKANSEYRTEIDNFRKIELLNADYSSPNSVFKITAKNGLEIFYGNGGAFRDENALHIPSGTNVPLTWAIREERDPFGNNIFYKYTDFGEGEYLITEIIYTGLGNTRGDRKIQITYEDKFKPETTYLAGSKVKRTKRIRSIETIAPGRSGSVRRYELKYRPSELSGQSLLTSVQECARGIDNIEHCRPATTFEWEDSPIAFRLHALEFEGGFNLDAADLFELGNDIDGDGRNDVFLKRQAIIPADFAEFADQAAPGEKRVLSFDKDGIEMPVSPELRDMLAVAPDVSFEATRTQFNGSGNLNRDFNKDGRTDYLFSENGQIAIAYFNGMDFQTVSTNIPAAPFGTGQTFYAENGSFNIINTGVYNVFEAGDFNGDGRIDLLIADRRNGSVLDGELVLYLDCTEDRGNGIRDIKFCRQPGFLYDMIDIPGIFDINPSPAVNIFVPQGEKVSGASDLDGNGLPDFFIESGSITSLENNRVTDMVLLSFLDANGNLTLQKRSLASIGLPTNLGTAKKPLAFSFVDINGDQIKDFVSTDGYRLANGKDITNGGACFLPLTPFTTSIDLFSETCREGDECDFRPRGSSLGAFGEQKALDIDGDGIDELLFPSKILLPSCILIGAGGDQTPAEPMIDCGFNQGNPFHVYGWSIIDFEENKDGSFTANRKDYYDDLISTPAFNNIGDINGDGKIDLWTMLGFKQGDFNLSGAPDHFYLGGFGNFGGEGPRFSRNESGDDLLSAVTTGLGFQSKFYYQTLSDTDDPHACGFTQERPFYKVEKESIGGAYFHFTSAKKAVAKFEQSNGIGGFNTMHYRYEDNMFNHEGRGLQGFERIVVEQADTEAPQNNLRMVMDFHQKYPLTGKLKSMRMELVTDDIVAIDEERKNPISRQEFNYNITPDNPQNERIKLARVFETLNRSFTYDYQKEENPSSQRDLLVVQETQNIYGNGTANDPHIKYGRPSKVIDIVKEGNSNRPDRAYRSEMQMLYEPVDESIWAVDILDKTISDFSPVVYQDDNTVTLATGTNEGQSEVMDFDINPINRSMRKLTEQAGTPSELIMENVEFDVWGNPIREVKKGSGAVDRLGAAVTRTTLRDFTASNGYFENSMDLGLGMKIDMDYDLATGAIRSMTDANNLSTTMRFDAFGTMIESKSPKQPTERNSLQACPNGKDCAMQLFTVQDGKPSQTIYLDVLGRTISTATESFENRFSGRRKILTKSKYDYRGRLVEELGSHFETDTQKMRITTGDFDALSRPGWKITDAEPQYRKVNYQYLGFRTNLTVDTRDSQNENEPTDNPLQTLSRVYNSFDQLLQTVDQLGNVTDFRYDGKGNLIATKVQDVQDAANAMTVTMTYNPFDQRTSITNPNNGTKRNSFNAFGDLLSQEDANGDVISFDYDILGRTTKRFINGVEEIEYSYDRQLIGLRDFSNKINEGVRIESTYDALGQEIKRQLSIPELNRVFELQMEYDSYYGRVKAMTYPMGEKIVFNYDTFGFKRFEYNPNAAPGKQNLKQIVETDARGNLLQVNLGNGIEEFRDFHTSGQVRKIYAGLDAEGSNSGIANIDYAYDDWGDLKVVKNNAASFEDRHSFDALHRLVKSEHRSSIGSKVINYAFDGLGNLRLKDDFANTYQYGQDAGANFGPNQVGRISKVDGSVSNFTYDANGNMKTGDGRNMEYNALNKPTQIVKNGNSTSFSYGPDDLRFKQVALTDSLETRTYYMGKLLEWIEKKNLQTNEKAPTEVRSYVGDYLLSTVVIDTVGQEKAPVQFYLHKEALGSTDAITNQEGELVERRSHDPFGKPRNAVGEPKDELASKVSQRGFTDHEHLDEVQLIHMNGRAYDFNLGRFLSVDPFVVSPDFSQSFNAYSYVLNNPLTFVDPTGYAPDSRQRFIDKTIAGMSKTVSGGRSRAAEGKNKSGEPNNGNSDSATDTDNAPSKVDDEEAKLRQRFREAIERARKIRDRRSPSLKDEPIILTEKQIKDVINFDDSVDRIAERVEIASNILGSISVVSGVINIINGVLSFESGSTAAAGIQLNKGFAQVANGFELALGDVNTNSQAKVDAVIRANNLPDGIVSAGVAATSLALDPDQFRGESTIVNRNVDVGALTLLGDFATGLSLNEQAAGKLIVETADQILKQGVNVGNNSRGFREVLTDAAEFTVELFTGED